VSEITKVTARECYKTTRFGRKYTWLFCGGHI